MEFYNNAKSFIEDMPYKQEKYGGRNWGHAWHSLCSYHGKLKPSIAHFLIKNFTKPGDVVFDPLSGVGTIPLEACLQGRVGIGNDLSKLAYAVTRAKVSQPQRENVDYVVENLKTYIEQNKEKFNTNPLPYEDFGFNGKLPTYYEKSTYLEILAAREFFQKKNNITDEESMVLSALLHVLHGNRPYALSRKSHPLTPYKPSGDYIYKNVIDHVNHKLDISYKRGELGSAIKGKAMNQNILDIDEQDIRDVDYIITSPPFTGSIRFYMNNWLRLWFTGWEEQDYKEADSIFLEGKQKKSMDIYYSFFEMCNDVLKENGKVILHLGNSKVCDMAEELSNKAKEYFVEIYRGAENVTEIEKHGIKDKGSTFEHQYLFLQKK